jgi:hypothetical protein
MQRLHEINVEVFVVEVRWGREESELPMAAVKS